jgi:D-alanine-D-alanine ligase
MKKKIHVGLLFGGRSGEHEVSVASALSVYAALDKSRYDVTLIGIDKQGQWHLPEAKTFLIDGAAPMSATVPEAANSVGAVPEVRIPRVDVVLPILHGTYGEDGTIQGLLELAQIPYAGSGVLGSSVGMDKDVARRLLTAAGIKTVPTRCVRKHEYAANMSATEEKILREFQFPFFIKPANAGSSVGVHKIKAREQLAPALRDAFAFDLKVLVEKGVAARELECAVLGNDEPRASVVGEVIPRHEFYSYEAKYLDADGVELAAPAKDLPPPISDKIREWALLAFRTLECRGLARVDFFLDKNTGELYLNEINTIPGFTSVSMYPRMWQASGLSYPALLDELIRLALENFEQRKALKTTYDVSEKSEK